MARKLPFIRVLTAVAGVLFIRVGTIGFSNLQGAGGNLLPILEIYTIIPIILGVGMVAASIFSSVTYYRIMSRTLAGVAILFTLTGMYSILRSLVAGIGPLSLFFIIVLGVGGIFLGFVSWWFSGTFDIERPDESTSDR